MSATLKGKAAIFGIGALTATGAIISSTTQKVQSMDFDSTSETATVADEFGEDVTLALFNPVHNLTITVIPIGAAISNVTTNVSNLFQTVGTQVTIADDQATILTATQSAKYVLLSAKHGRTNKGFATIEVTLKQWVNNDLSTSPS